MGDAGACAHHLHIAGRRAAFVAQVVLVGDGAFAHIGDDLHVRMRVRRKTGLRLDRVVVPDPQNAPVHALRIVVIGNVVGTTQARDGTTFDHGSPLQSRKRLL